MARTKVSKIILPDDGFYVYPIKIGNYVLFANNRESSVYLAELLFVMVDLELIDFDDAMMTLDHFEENYETKSPD
jgi:hypothetical protein